MHRNTLSVGMVEIILGGKDLEIRSFFAIRGLG